MRKRTAFLNRAVEHELDGVSCAVSVMGKDSSEFKTISSREKDKLTGNLYKQTEANGEVGSQKPES
jgi:hypothetical protein